MTIRVRSLSRALWSLSIAALLFGAGAFRSLVMAQEQNDGSRQIVAEEFTKSRPIKPPQAAAPRRGGVSSTGARARPSNSSANLSRRPHYKRVPTNIPADVVASAKSNSTASTPAESMPVGSAKVGVTIWRLRPSRSADSGARILVMENAKETQWTPERISANTPLHVNDRVRLTIESPRDGYLYVVDREQYADRSLGEPYLIFPTRRTNGGDNRVRPGKLVDLPTQEDNPNYFTLVPSPSREDQVAEVLSIIITTEPLENLQLSDKPAKLSKSQVEKWEKQWQTRVEEYEMEGGAGQTWTKEEREASAEGTGRYLTQEDPSPQTIYLVEGRNNKGLLVTLPLRYRR